MCISSGIQDKIDPASWVARKAGWAGFTNPANILDTRVEGLTGFGSGKTETEKRAIKMGIQQQQEAHQATRVTGPPAHALAIAAHKAKGT